MNQKFIQQVANKANEELNSIKVELEDVKSKINGDFFNNLPNYVENYYRLSRNEFWYQTIQVTLSNYDSLTNLMPIERIVQLWCKNLMYDILHRKTNFVNPIKNVIARCEKEEDVKILSFLIENFKNNISFGVEFNDAVTGINKI